MLQAHLLVVESSVAVEAHSESTQYSRHCSLSAVIMDATGEWQETHTIMSIPSPSTRSLRYALWIK